jgi:hypothetical protein
MGASSSIHKADSAIYCVVRVALVSKTDVSRPAGTDDSRSRFCNRDIAQSQTELPVDGSIHLFGRKRWCIRHRNTQTDNR